MKPILISSSNAALSAPTPVGEPIGQPAAFTRITMNDGPHDDHISTGVWECSPGVWRRQLLLGEFSHFVAGWCFFTADGQDPIEIKAGDAVFFPAGCEGTWDIRETVRKTFVLLK